MRVLVTGANGYIGKRLSIHLNNNHEVIGIVRDSSRVSFQENKNITLINHDFGHDTNFEFDKEIDVAFYFIHSLKIGNSSFQEHEKNCAKNFLKVAKKLKVKQIIYLGGIVKEKTDSEHLSSRFEVEKILINSGIPTTILRSGIVIGSGSASFEIVRDLVEKLPFMVAPKWVKTLAQPIAIRDVLTYLEKSMLNENLYNRSFDIGGPEIMTYEQMLLRFAKIRGLKRRILNVNVLSPRLSSYWLYFITSTNYNIAKHLVNSMRFDVTCDPSRNLQNEIPIHLSDYTNSIERAFDKIEQGEVISSWKDTLSSGELDKLPPDLIHVPKNACFRDVKFKRIKSIPNTIKNIWSIGGKKGWYGYEWLWKIRGFMDELVGGVGLNRGRKNLQSLDNGDAVDFWRVVYANKKAGKLILYAEMKLPGEAWLEFEIKKGDSKNIVKQIATFRPKGLKGRIYWYSVLPFHYFVFNKMIDGIAE